MHGLSLGKAQHSGVLSCEAVKWRRKSVYSPAPRQDEVMGVFEEDCSGLSLWVPMTHTEDSRQSTHSSIINLESHYIGGSRLTM